MQIVIQSQHPLIASSHLLAYLQHRSHQIQHLQFRPSALLLTLSEMPSEAELDEIRQLPEVQAVSLGLQNANSFAQIITEQPKMLALIEQAKTFADLNAPLLIQGETGTGKDLFAKACHDISTRSAEKFIAVNCAGLPAENAESEMFGQHKQSIGFFEYAQGGTVLLDAVAELSLEMQAKLLRFLNDGSFRRVGEDQEVHVNVRVICTSQKPLAELVAEGKMREDLYHRLNVLSLNLPPLRERNGDIPLLTAHFVKQICQELNLAPLSYNSAFLEHLQHYDWRGNVRELYNALYRACSLAQDGKLHFKDLNLPEPTLLADLSHFPTEQGTLDELMGQFEQALLKKFYHEYPSTRKLAQRLGISHTAVANKLRLYGIGKA